MRLKWYHITLSIVCLVAGNPARAIDCKSFLDPFNQAVDEAREADAQALIDKIAGSADCGRYQTAA